MSTDVTDAVELTGSSVPPYSPENPAPVIEPPRTRTKRTPRNSRTNFEMYGWLFMRLSGVVLVVLIFGHLFVNLLVGEGIHAIDFGFVAGKWADPFWQFWDLAMLWLAMLHGGNGLRTVINDYAEQANTRVWLKTLLFTAVAFTIVLGSLVIFTFDPNIR